MKSRTNISKHLSVLTMMSVLLTGAMALETATAQNLMDAQISNTCHSGFTGTWIIGNACDLGGRTNLKTDDAMVVQCDADTKLWSVDFYEEPANADPNDPISQATRYPLCPGNGRLLTNADGELVLRCNFWESVDNVAKQLELQPQASTEPNIKSISWQSSELENPNVVCGIAGRPESGTDVGSGGQTIN